MSFLSAPTGGGAVYVSRLTNRGEFPLVSLIALTVSDGREVWQKPLKLPENPVLAEGVVYTADGYGKVYAFRSTDGAELWSFDPGQGEPSGSVAVARGVIYTGGGNPGASIFALRDGREIWSFPTGGTALGPFVARRVVYIANDGQNAILALRAGDGTKLWDASIGTGASGILATADALYVTADNSAVNSLSRRSGAKLWQSFPSTAGPLISGSTVFLADYNAELYALRASDGTKIWRFGTGNRIQAIASYADKVYVASNNLYALRAIDGTKIWSFPAQGQSIIAADGVIYLASTGNEIFAFNA
jgi:outer membrane protein assembly factor BamB